MKKPSAVRMSLAQARRIFEDHFEKEMPGSMFYSDAAKSVEKEIGIDEFLIRLSGLNRDGSDKGVTT